MQFSRTGVLIVSLALVTGLAAGCDDDSPTDPSDADATFTAALSPANEVPPVSNAEASGSGTVTITLDAARDSAGTITSARVDFQVNLANFPNGTALTAAHIHTGNVGQNGAVVVNTGLTAGEVVLTTGNGSFTKTGISVTPQTAQDILNNPGSFYFNVHSVLNPDGIARGQLVRQ
jgi:hypothetical protein